MSVVYDPLIGRPVIGMPNPELKRPTPQQRPCWHSLLGDMLFLSWLFSIRSSANNRPPRVTGTGIHVGCREPSPGGVLRRLTQITLPLALCSHRKKIPPERIGEASGSWR